MNDHPGMASISFLAALLLDRFPDVDGYAIRLVPDQEAIVAAVAAAALPDEAEVEVEDDGVFWSLVAQNALVGLALLLTLVHFVIARRRRRN